MHEESSPCRYNKSPTDLVDQQTRMQKKRKSYDEPKVSRSRDLEIIIMPQESDNASYDGAQKIPYSYSSAMSSSHMDGHSLSEISEKLSELSLPCKQINSANN